MSGLPTQLIHHPYRAPDGYEAVPVGVFKGSTIFFDSVAELRAVVGQRIERPEGARVAEPGPSEAARQRGDRSAVVPEHKAGLAAPLEAEIGSVAVGLHLRRRGRAVAETEGAERNPVSYRLGLGARGNRGQAQGECRAGETAFP